MKRINFGVLFLLLASFAFAQSPVDEAGEMLGFYREKALLTEGADTELFDGVLCPTDTLNYAYVGKVTPVVDEGTPQHDAYLWIKDRFGYLYQTTLLPASSETRDEVAVGIANISTSDFIAVVHQADAFIKDSVQYFDNVLIHRVKTDTLNPIDWTAEYVLEGGGIAPVDVLVGGPEGNIYVLVNKLEEGVTSVGYLEYTPNGVFVTESTFYAASGGSFGHEFVQVGSETFVSAAFSYDDQKSEAITWDVPTGAVVNSEPLAINGANNRFYGIAFDAISEIYYTAGYASYSGDTVAVLAELNSSTSVQVFFELDSAGTQSKYRDVAFEDNTLSIAGTCQTCGEDTVKSLVMTSLDRVLALRFSKFLNLGTSVDVNSVVALTNVSLGEHVITLGKGYKSLTAPVMPQSGGIWSFTSYYQKSSGAFQAPRIVFMADIVCNGEDSKYDAPNYTRTDGVDLGKDHRGVDCTYPKMSNKHYVDNRKIHLKEFNIVLIYDIDRIQLHAESVQKGVLDEFLHDLCRKGKKIGTILGENVQDFAQVLKFIDDLNTNTKYQSYDMPIVLLEHEFWTGGEGLITSASQSTIPLYGTSPTDTNRLVIQWTKAKQHIALLDILHTKMSKTVNLLTLMDYVSNPLTAYQNSNGVNSTGPKLIHPDYATASTSLQNGNGYEQMLEYFTASTKFVDYTVFAYYRKPNHYNYNVSPYDSAIHYDINPLVNSLWFSRNQAYFDAANANDKDLYQIPIHSVEGSGETDAYRYAGTYGNLSWGLANNIKKEGYDQNLDAGVVGDGSQDYYELNAWNNAVGSITYDNNHIGHYFDGADATRNSLADVEDLWYSQYNLDTNPSYFQKSISTTKNVYIPGHSYYHFEHYLYIRTKTLGTLWESSQNATNSEDICPRLSWKIR
jgi:hypothetical protein